MFKFFSIITSRGKNYRSLQNSNWSPDVGHADWTRVLPPLYGYRKIRVYAVQGAKPRSNGATSCIPINQQSPYPLNYNDWRPAFGGECRALIMGRVLELRTRHLWARCKSESSARNRVSPKGEEMANAADHHERRICQHYTRGRNKNTRIRIPSFRLTSDLSLTSTAESGRIHTVNLPMN